MAVIKFKPARSPRVLDGRAQTAQEHTDEAVRRAQSAVARSRKLVKQSKAVVDAAKKNRAG